MPRVTGVKSTFDGIEGGSTNIPPIEESSQTDGMPASNVHSTADEKHCSIKNQLSARSKTSKTPNRLEKGKWIGCLRKRNVSQGCLTFEPGWCQPGWCSASVSVHCLYSVNCG